MRVGNHDNRDSAHEDLVMMYQRAHEELHHLQAIRLPASDSSPDAEAVRVAIVDRKRALRALGYALAGGALSRVGESLLPLGEVTVSLN